MEEKDEILDVYILNPIKNFINRSTSSGIVLFAAAVLALAMANSPLKDFYNSLWHIRVHVGIGGFAIDKDLGHWINDGLMAIFFFVVGLELKREVMAGELSKPKNALLPIAAAIGGMIVPALIYFFINHKGEAAHGWGIPMATDIAFALGVLFLLGKSVPLSLKVFLTALAIVDDIGAVLVIAFFYTSSINYDSLIIGGVFFVVLVIANLLKVRSMLFYSVVGICGLWVAFLMSGIHATIAAVILAATIPAKAKLSKSFFTKKMKQDLEKIGEHSEQEGFVLSHHELDTLASMNRGIRKTVSPLQRVEHSLHPFVSFVVMPIFAFANAGVTVEGDFLALILQPVTFGVMLGLLAGKFIGVVGATYLMDFLKIASIPKDMNKWHVIGVGFLAAVGFTMSLFITGLALDGTIYGVQAKLSILLTSAIASAVGYFTIKYANSKKKE